MSVRGSADRARRLAARGFGRRGEWVALALLLLRGHRIVARNFSAAGGEIDIVAVKGTTIVFVEVKARPRVDMARTAISFEKRQRIGRAVKTWLARNRWAQGYTLRGDAVFVSPWHWPEHLIAAFDLDLG
jgi:putative endonuclease